MWNWQNRITPHPPFLKVPLSPFTHVVKARIDRWFLVVRSMLFRRWSLWNYFYASCFAFDSDPSAIGPLVAVPLCFRIVVREAEISVEISEFCEVYRYSSSFLPVSSQFYDFRWLTNVLYFSISASEVRNIVSDNGRIFGFGVQNFAPHDRCCHITPNLYVAHTDHFFRCCQFLWFTPHCRYNLGNFDVIYLFIFYLLLLFFIVYNYVGHICWWLVRG